MEKWKLFTLLEMYVLRCVLVLQVGFEQHRLGSALTAAAVVVIRLKLGQRPGIRRS